MDPALRHELDCQNHVNLREPRDPNEKAIKSIKVEASNFNGHLDEWPSLTI